MSICNRRPEYILVSAPSDVKTQVHYTVFIPGKTEESFNDLSFAEASNNSFSGNLWIWPVMSQADEQDGPLSVRQRTGKKLSTCRVANFCVQWLNPPSVSVRVTLVSVIFSLLAISLLHFLSPYFINFLSSYLVCV